MVGKSTPIGRLRALPLAGGVGLSWLGQAGFILRTDSAIALIDPFLSRGHNREYLSTLLPSAATGIDVVLCTHEHIDHFDAESAPAIAKASPQAVFVVPTPIVDMVTEVGIAPDRVVGVQPDADPLELAGLSIRAVPAMHGVTMEDAYGFGEELSGGLIRFVGFVIDARGVRLYHAGDTIEYPGMEDRLSKLDIDVAMLPINGRDAAREERGIVGNLSEREAASLANAIAAHTVIPMHYDLFARNRGYPEWLVESITRDHAGPNVLVPTVELPFAVGPSRER